MIATRSIIRGALTRTLPATWLGIYVLFAIAIRGGSQLPLHNLVMGMLEGLPVAIGSAVALIGLRKRLRADAGVEGRRAFLVGLAGVALTISVAPFVAMRAPAEYLFTGACGLAIALAVFFPWIESRGAHDASLHELHSLSIQDDLPSGSDPGRERSPARATHGVT
jgi:hypothetical protein